MADKMSNTAIRATLAYDGFPPIDFKALEKDIAHIFRNILLQFDRTEAQVRKHANFFGEQLCLSVARDKDDILIWIEDGTGINRADLQTKLAACYHVVRHLLTIERADSVYWHYTGKCYTAEGFEARIALDTSDGPIMPEPEPVRDNIFGEDFLSVGSTHQRLDDSFVRKITVKKEAAGPASSKAILFPEIAEQLEAATRPDTDDDMRDLLRQALYPDGNPGQDVRRDTVIFGPGQACDRLDRSETTARLATYALNTTLLVTAMPVGAALMTYNMLGGENFRLTAQVTALTGAFLGTGVMGNLTQVFQMI